MTSTRSIGRTALLMAAIAVIAIVLALNLIRERAKRLVAQREG